MTSNGGHSDSMDPGSFKNPPGPLFNNSVEVRDAVGANWAYIRVPGLGILNTLCCPHYDMTGSNGVHRSEDFTKLLASHSGEHAIGIDNWAALVIDGENYRVVSRKGYPGSVLPDGSFSVNRSGLPGMWRLGIDIATGKLQRTLVPAKGLVADLIIKPRWIVEDSQVVVARGQNPDDGRAPSWAARSKYRWKQ